MLLWIPIYLLHKIAKGYFFIWLSVPKILFEWAYHDPSSCKRCEILASYKTFGTFFWSHNLAAHFRPWNVFFASLELGELLLRLSFQYIVYFDHLVANSLFTVVEFHQSHYTWGDRKRAATLLDMHLRTANFKQNVLPILGAFQNWFRRKLYINWKPLQNSFRNKDKIGKSFIHSVTKLLWMRKYHF